MDKWEAGYFFGGGNAVAAFSYGHNVFHALFLGIMAMLVMAAVITFRRWLDTKTVAWRRRVVGR